jgi:hypothetical protein
VNGFRGLFTHVMTTVSDWDNYRYEGWESIVVMQIRLVPASIATRFSMSWKPICENF